jgi:hypothetical protein
MLKDRSSGGGGSRQKGGRLPGHVIVSSDVACIYEWLYVGVFASYMLSCQSIGDASMCMHTSDVFVSEGCVTLTNIAFHVFTVTCYKCALINITHYLKNNHSLSIASRALLSTEFHALTV